MIGNFACAPLGTLETGIINDPCAALAAAANGVVMLLVDAAKGDIATGLVMVEVLVVAAEAAEAAAAVDAVDAVTAAPLLLMVQIPNVCVCVNLVSGGQGLLPRHLATKIKGTTLVTYLTQHFPPPMHCHLPSPPTDSSTSSNLSPPSSNAFLARGPPPASG